MGSYKVPCEVCLENETEELKCRKQDIDESYGKVSSQEYSQRLHDYENDISEIGNYNLEESYSIGVAQGVFSVSYRAFCMRCGFKYGYKYSESTGEIDQSCFDNLFLNKSEMGES